MLSYDVKLTKKAQNDLDKIATYYEQQSELGHRFAIYFSDCLMKLKHFPNAFGASLKPETREMVLHEFLFIAVYRVLKTTVFIITVYHQSKQMP